MASTLTRATFADLKVGDTVTLNTLAFPAYLRDTATVVRVTATMLEVRPADHRTARGGRFNRKTGKVCGGDIWDRDYIELMVEGQGN